MPFASRLLLLGVLVPLLLSSCSTEAPPPPATTVELQRPVPTVAPTASPPAPRKPLPVPPRIAEQLQRLSDFYKGLRSFTVHTTLDVRLNRGGSLQNLTCDSNLAVERPDKFTFRSQPGPIAMDIVNDHQQVIVNLPALKRYSCQESPASLAELADGPLIPRLGGPGPGRILFLLLSEDFHKQLCEGVTWYDDRGIETLNDRKTHRLRLVHEEGEINLWFDDHEKEPFVRQISMTSAPPRSGNSILSNAAPPQTTTTTRRRFDDWKINPTIPADTFTFTPPETSKEVEGDLFANLTAGDKSPTDLLGKSVPPMELTRLDGQPFKLADHVGKDIVLLDFWATWCRECRAEMPLVAEIADEYAAKHVAVYAVNYREPAAKVQNYLQKNSIKLPIVLDSQGNTTHGLNIDAIPVLLLIDRRGILQSVHIGFGKDLKAVLKEELDTLLAGKSLVKAPSSPAK